MEGRVREWPEEGAKEGDGRKERFKKIYSK